MADNIPHPHKCQKRVMMAVMIRLLLIILVARLSGKLGWE